LCDDGDADDDLAEFSIGTDRRDPKCLSGPGSAGHTRWRQPSTVPEECSWRNVATSKTA
jgi:hypothetical protein